MQDDVQFVFISLLLLFGYVTSADAVDKTMSEEKKRNMTPEVQKMFERMQKGMNRDIAPKIRQLIKDNLQIGASSAEIEAFLAKYFNGGSYNRFNRSYNTIIRGVAHDPRVDQAVMIRLYVDEEKRFVRSEVKDSFTGP